MQGKLPRLCCVFFADEGAIINDILKKLVGVTEDVLDKIEGSLSTFQLKCPLEKCKFVTVRGVELKTHIISTHYKLRSYKVSSLGLFISNSNPFLLNFYITGQISVDTVYNYCI